MAYKSDRPQNRMTNEDTGPELEEKVIFINRVAKVVKGGRRFSFSALVVVGDKAGKVGIGYGKAMEVPESIRKAIAVAKRNLKEIYLKDGTIPYDIEGKFGAGHVIMRPASKGTGVIAGGPVRAVLEVLGVTDILTKSLGTSNPQNVVNATMQGLTAIRSPEQIRKVRETVMEEE